MNLLLLKSGDFIGEDRVEISGRRFQHLKKILKVIPGQTLSVGILNGKTGRGTVELITRQSIILSIETGQEPPSPFDCTLILALPRPLMVKRILQAVSSLGIKDIHLIQTDEVEKSYWLSSDLEMHTLEEQLCLGLEQSIDTVLPQVTLHRHFKTFSREILPHLAAGRRCLLAHPGNHPPCPANVDTPLALAVGPEGGFTKAEVDTFTENGFRGVQIGKRILRVETAVNVLLGRLLPCQDF